MDRMSKMLHKCFSKIALSAANIRYFKLPTVKLHEYCKHWRQSRLRGHGEHEKEPPRQHAGEEEATLFENLWWKSWTNVRVSSAIIYDPLQLCKYQHRATFLTANDGLSFSIIMTDQRWIIHLRALKYAITLQLLGIHLSRHRAVRLRKPTQHLKEGRLWSCMFCCLVLLTETKMHNGETSCTNSPTSEGPDLWPSTTKSCRSDELFPKHNQSILKQKKNHSPKKSNIQVS